MQTTIVNILLAVLLLLAFADLSASQPRGVSRVSEGVRGRRLQDMNMDGGMEAKDEEAPVEEGEDGEVEEVDKQVEEDKEEDDKKLDGELIFVYFIIVIATVFIVDMWKK